MNRRNYGKVALVKANVKERLGKSNSNYTRMYMVMVRIMGSKLNCSIKKHQLRLFP